MDSPDSMVVIMVRENMGKERNDTKPRSGHHGEGSEEEEEQENRRKQRDLGK